MKSELIKAAFNAIVNNTKDLIFIKDENSVYYAASEPFVKMTDKSTVSEVIGHTDLEIFNSEALAKRYIADDKKLLSEDKDLVNYVEPITDEDGKARYASTSKYVLRDKNGKKIGILGITKDITREYIARQRYQQEFKYLFELPKDTYAVCYIDVDDWRIICQRRQNISDGTIQECQTVAEMCGYAIESIADESCKAAEFYRNFTSERLRDVYSSGRRTLSFKYERIMSDNSSRWVRNEVNFLTDADSGHLCVMLSAKDINEIKLEEQRLFEAAKLDSMTMLLNHETSMDYITEVLANENDRQHALFMLDIDNFKDLNDNFGHQAGDEFLVEIAKELKNHFRESDIVGRIGGDEFFALMRNVSEESQIKRKAEDVLAIIESISSEYKNINLSGSIGISLYPKDGKTLKELYAKSDKALYKAKRSGKNKYLFI